MSPAGCDLTATQPHQSKHHFNTERAECPREPVRRRGFRHRNAVTRLEPDEVTKNHPTDTREQANSDRYSPAPTDADKEQEKIGEVELFLDSQGPKHAVDRVAGVWIEVVEHQQMHAEVVKEKVSEVETDGPCGQE